MWKEIIAILFGVVAVIFAVGYFYWQMPGEPIELGIVESNSTSEDIIIDYGATPVFAENLRFNHNLISYYIEPDCPEERNQKMKQAFAIFHNEINIISFYGVQKDKADILVGCSADYLDTKNGMFIAGEGGPSKYLNGTLFNVILEGKVTLYKETECEDYPVVELHELLHVFGFNHVNNPNSIMYNVSKCEQKITQDMVDTISSLYAVKPLPDIYIDEAQAVKKRYYLDFNISVKNRGLIDVGEVTLIVSTESGTAKEFEMGNVSIFTTRTLTVQNLKLPSRFDEEIRFEAITNNNATETDMTNNIVTMKVED